MQANICNTSFQICLFRAVAHEKINLEETKFQPVSRLSEKEQRERILSPCHFSSIEKNERAGLTSFSKPQTQIDPR